MNYLRTHYFRVVIHVYQFTLYWQKSCITLNESCMLQYLETLDEAVYTWSCFVHSFCSMQITEFRMYCTPFCQEYVLIPRGSVLEWVEEENPERNRLTRVRPENDH